VSIDGAVLRPGAYPYVERMTVKDLVFAAGNVLESAHLDSAEISSQEIVKDSQTVRTTHRAVSLRNAIEGLADDNLALKPYDRLYIKRLSGWGKERFANIMGEVKFPGRYALRDGERLSDLVERAGGYKDTAYLRGAVFTRPSVQELQQKNLGEMAKRLQRELLAQTASVTSTSSEGLEAKKIELQQKQAFIDSVKGLRATGRMTVRLAHARLLKGSEFDIQLEDGDAVFVPMNNRVVNVMGAVMSDSSLVYIEKALPKDYIQAAGGYTRYADARNAYVLKVDGSARKLQTGTFNWSESKDRWEIAGFGEEIRQIEPGDTIVVPEKLERIAWLREIKDITQILSNVAVAAGAVYLFGK
jgi:polysaccharide biosynthesis/export protein